MEEYFFEVNMKGILVVSFGTSFDETREKNIGAIERACETYSLPVYRAFTSNMIRKSLAKRDILINDTKMALEKMLKDGIDEVFVLPTHLLFGDEYNKMMGLIDEVSSSFKSVKIAKPLLANENDYRVVLNAIYKETPKDEDEAIILMGHGTEHFYNAVYSALNFIATEENMQDMYIVTVEAYPDFDRAISWAKKNGFKKAKIAPLMLVAGDHAVNDMASDEEDSLKTLLKNEGISATPIIKGLGEYKEILELYISHLEEIM